MTPELLNHLSDLSKVRLAIALLEGCREMTTDINGALTLLRFVERLQAQAIARETA